MTAVEKFVICRALFHSQTYPEPVAAQQYRMAVNAVANVVCPTIDENRAFRELSGRDNWISDNPFVDD